MIDFSKKISTKFFDRHKFMIFISGSITISFVLVLISMAMYGSSGAAQLDLSRPGYINVRSQADTKINSYKDYPSTGLIDLSVIDDFTNIFNAQSNKVLTADAFSGDPLSPEALGIGAVF